MVGNSYYVQRACDAHHNNNLQEDADDGAEGGGGGITGKVFCVHGIHGVYLLVY